MRIPRFWGIHAEPTPRMNWVLAVLPFLLLVSVYLISSHLRLSENPQDKILPSISQMADAVERCAFKADPHTGEYLLWKDTFSSLRRLLMGAALSSFCGLLVGLGTGLFPGLRSVFLVFVTFLSVIPPLALLPILFITFGVEESAKIALIFIGTFPMISRDIYLAVEKTPREQIVKALTLGASSLQVAYRIVLPQIMPRLIDTTRLSLGAVWLFLIAAEAIASTDGLGYRIFLVRRYLSMDIIIPYVLWITSIGFFMDWSLRKFMKWRYKWYLVGRI